MNERGWWNDCKWFKYLKRNERKQFFVSRFLSIIRIQFYWCMGLECSYSSNNRCIHPDGPVILLSVFLFNCIEMFPKKYPCNYSNASSDFEVEIKSNAQTNTIHTKNTMNANRKYGFHAALRFRLNSAIE